MRKPTFLANRTAQRSRSSTTKHQKLYGSQRWRKASRRFLDANPLCRICRSRGIIVKATQTDHIRDHGGDETAFWDETGWQPLCAGCHAAKTHGGPAVKGCDQAGFPIDPGHTWRQEDRS